MYYIIIPCRKLKRNRNAILFAIPRSLLIYNLLHILFSATAINTFSEDKNALDGGMNDHICCNDSLLPVSFYIEALEEDAD